MSWIRQTNINILIINVFPSINSALCIHDKIKIMFRHTFHQRQQSHANFFLQLSHSSQPINKQTHKHNVKLDVYNTKHKMQHAAKQQAQHWCNKQNTIKHQITYCTTVQKLPKITKNKNTNEWSPQTINKNKNQNPLTVKDVMQQGKKKHLNSKNRYQTCTWII